MQKVLVLMSAIFLFSIGVFAQQGNADSLSLVAKIEADKVKLSDLQVQLEQRVKSQQDALAKAQKSADENASAAEKLSNDPKHKRLAKRADKKATEARKDARNARIEMDKVNRLNKDIRSAKKRIAKNQGRLEKLKHRTPLAGK